MTRWLQLLLSAAVRERDVLRGPLERRLRLLWEAVRLDAGRDLLSEEQQRAIERVRIQSGHHAFHRSEELQTGGTKPNVRPTDRGRKKEGKEEGEGGGGKEEGEEEGGRRRGRRRGEEEGEDEGEGGRKLVCHHAHSSLGTFQTLRWRSLRARAPEGSHLSSPR